MTEMLMLTDARDGSAIYIRPRVTAVFTEQREEAKALNFHGQELATSYEPARTIVLAEGFRWIVKETPEEVVNMLAEMT